VGVGGSGLVTWSRAFSGVSGEASVVSLLLLLVVLAGMMWLAGFWG